MMLEHRPQAHGRKKEESSLTAMFSIVLYLEKQLKKHLKIQDKVMVTHISFNLILLGHFYI